MNLAHLATTNQIGSGDLLGEWVASPDHQGPCPPPDGMSTATCESFFSLLPFVFATGPALAFYDDGQGNSGPVSYPHAIDDPLPVEADPMTGEVTLALSVWRSQRRPVEGELCPPPDERLCDPESDWIDIGGLRYSNSIGSVANSGGGPCPQAAFAAAAPPDDELDHSDPPGDPTGFTDLARDRAPAGDVITYRLQVTACSLAEEWNVGERLGLNFEATTLDGKSSAEQNLAFELQP